MALIERLVARDETKIQVHALHSVMAEMARGRFTRQQAIDLWSLGAEDLVDFDAILAKLIAHPESYAIGAFVNLANVGTAYDAVPASRGLGVLWIEGGGITKVEFGVRYDKVGTGTLSFQLWDETTGTELCVVNDAAAAGNNKTGVATFNAAAPVAVGRHVLRVRCKSTVGTDDPVYLGSTIVVTRVDVTSPEVLHQVVLLAEIGVVYPDAASVRARLGL